MSYFDGREEQKTGEKDQARPAQGQQALPKNADIVLTE